MLESFEDIELDQLPDCHGQVFRYLRDQTNKDHTITSATLEELFDIKGTDVRNIVRYYRYSEQEWICSSSNGYWMAQTWHELEPTIHHLQQRGEKLLRLAKILEKSRFKNENGQGEIF